MAAKKFRRKHGVPVGVLVRMRNRYFNASVPMAIQRFSGRDYFRTWFHMKCGPVLLLQKRGAW